MRVARDKWIVSIIIVVAVSVATGAVAIGQSTWLEAVSFVTGAVCVWLTVKQSAWNFPISLMNVATFLFVFAQAQLYADAGLQVVYFVLTAVGWWMWLFGGKGRTPLIVSWAGRTEMLAVAMSGAVLFVGLWQLLHYVGGSVTLPDALTTSLSLCAQWLLNRKRLQNWYFWIAVDIIYVPLYLYKELYLTAILFGIFLCMATMGFIEWRKAMRNAVEPSHQELVPA